VCLPLAISPPYGRRADRPGIDTEGLLIERIDERRKFSLVDAGASAIVSRCGQVVADVPDAMIGHTRGYPGTYYATLTRSRMSYGNNSICLRALGGYCHASADGTQEP